VDNFVDRAREGRGKGNTLKIFPGSPKLAGKKERGFRSTSPQGIFACLSCGAGPRILPAAGGGQLKVSVGIFPKKGSDFNQKRQHCTMFSFFRFVLRLAASRLGAEMGQISEIHFFAHRAKKI